MTLVFNRKRIWDHLTSINIIRNGENYRLNQGQINVIMYAMEERNAKFWKEIFLIITLSIGIIDFDTSISKIRAAFDFSDPEVETKLAMLTYELLNTPTIFEPSPV